MMTMVIMNSLLQRNHKAIFIFDQQKKISISSLIQNTDYRLTLQASIQIECSHLASDNKNLKYLGQRDIFQPHIE